MKSFTNRRRMVIATLCATITTGWAQAQNVLMWSSQASQATEQQAMRDNVFKSAPLSVEFIANEEPAYITRLNAELQAGKGQIGVLGALHGQLASNSKDLVDVSKLAKDLKISPKFMQLGKLGTGEQKYIPWMQATFVMVANRKALPFLPAGADINALTYDQLVQWSKNMAEKTGGPKFGFPAGPSGLKHRFFQGYLYPSYADSVVTEFRSAQAEKGWQMMVNLWQYTNPESTTYNHMQVPLLADQVWVAFDHVARLSDALNKRPDDFVAFPAPAGPAGRGFMPVLAGLAIPKTAPDRVASEKLIAHLMRPEVQLATLKSTNFFPTVDTKIPSDISNAARIAGEAVARQASAKDANPGLLPVGLGTQGGKFNQIYVDAFERIVLAKQPIRVVLDSQADALRKIMQETGAPCWEPDKASAGACPVK